MSYSRERKINRNVRGLVRRYVGGCIAGTRIDAKALAHQLSDRDRVYLTGTVAHLLNDYGNLRCDSRTVFVVV